MDYIISLLEKEWYTKTIISLFIVILAILLYKIVNDGIIKNAEKGKLKFLSSNKSKTYIRLINNINRYIFIIATFLLILKINGVNVTSMLAGVGIIGIIIGFAIQDALKDIIKGFDIISDSYYQVGDVIKFDDVTGKVLSIGLKTTKLQDIYTLNIVSISNRNIEKVEVVSNLINIDIPFPYELKVDETLKVIDNIVDRIKKLDKVNECEYRGLNNISSSSLDYQIKVYCKPIDKVQIRRDCLGCIVKTLEDNNIQIPYNQLDIHTK